MADEDTEGLLDGVRVLEMSHVMAAPSCGLLLADMGADVIKVERLPDGDQVRRSAPHMDGRSAPFAMMSRNKRGIAINPRSDEGRRTMLLLMEGSDVFLENYRPGAMTHYGLGYDQVKDTMPRLIYCSISGFGQTGPYGDQGGFDLVAQGMSGIMSFTGEPGRPPVRMGAPLGDLGGGAFAAHGILAALYRRERTGAGGKVDVSLLDCQLYLASYRAQYYLTAGEVARPMGTGHVSAVPVGAFECGDGGWLVMDAILPHFWEGLCGALDRPGWREDPRMATPADRLENRDHVNAELAGVFATAPAAHWLARLAAHGVPAGPIQTIDQALADPQVRAREMVVEMEHHALGSIETFNSPIKMEGTWGAAPSPPPLLGEHTEEVLREMLEMGEDEIARLRARGAI